MTPSFQVITHNSRHAAVLLHGDTILADGIPLSELPIVQAMCIYAKRINAGEIPGPYTTAGAEAFALDLLARPLPSRKRAQSAADQPPRQASV